jgi:hypothetical protein
MYKFFIFILLFFVYCTNPKPKIIEIEPKSVVVKDSLTLSKPITINDTLNSLAQIIAGNADSNTVYRFILKRESYKNFSNSFSKRWNNYDSTRIFKLAHFRNTELSKNIKSEKLIFYPFSGPDILYPILFFPDAEKFIMIGLEPVGTLSTIYNHLNDSLNQYYSKLNTSLNAILNFSFFRTISMSNDLKNADVDGTLHLLFLFLNRTGNKIISAKPITIDSLGKLIYFNSFDHLKLEKLKTKGIEIQFLTQENKVKEVCYFSLNAANDGLTSNTNFKKYLNSMSNFNTYLKGASYLLHKSNFSIIRNIILDGSSSIVQDDSGISLNYFLKQPNKWNFKLYGKYTHPISLFANCYQEAMDSLYDVEETIPLGFGIGYNFKDKNSNLMIANRK